MSVLDSLLDGLTHFASGVKIGRWPYETF